MSGALKVPNPSSMNRLSSSASTSTTRAQRGSPPPPETPIVAPGEQPGGGIEARYAAAGIAGASTLTSLQAQNAAAAQRANQYSSQAPRDQTLALQQPQDPPRRPWTPTEQPGSQPHGPPTVYQGPGQAPTSAPAQALGTQGQAGSPSTQSGRASLPNALEQDFQRMHVTASPPPAYSPSGSTSTHAQINLNEKSGHGMASGASEVTVGAGAGTTARPAAGVALPIDTSNQGHPAFANDPRQPNGFPAQTVRSSSQKTSQQFAKAPQALVGPGPGPASPPLLPEGWIAHLDQNSGQYYYIHLPTQSTQWEFPKGPTPLNLNEPLSPSASVYGGNP